jgi:hypothetical protein
MPRRKVHRPDAPCDQGSASGTFVTKADSSRAQQPGDVAYWPLANIDLRSANVCLPGNANEGRCGSLRNCDCALTVAIAFRQRGTVAKKSSLMHLDDRDERFYDLARLVCARCSS